MSEPVSSSGCGARLIAARQQRGQSLANLAAQLKVPEARLVALEAERWSDLPDGPYARGLATSLCRALGVDPAPVLATMPGAAPVALEKVSVGINRPLQLRANSRASASRLVWVIVGVLLLLALGIAFWPNRSELPWSWRPLWAGATEGQVEAQGPQEPEIRPEPPVQVRPAPRPVPAMQPALPASARPPASDTQAAVVVPTVAAPAPIADPLVRSPSLTVRAKEDTWVSIADAAGASLVARVLPAGETLALDIGHGPVRVVLGNAPGAELNWRGQAQDLTAFQAVRVARLTLN